MAVYSCRSFHIATSHSLSLPHIPRGVTIYQEQGTWHQVLFGIGP